MEINEAFVLQATGLAALTEIARQSAGADDFELLDWRVTQIGGGLGNPVSVGLYRVGGHGRAWGKAVPWTTILKVIQSPANVGWSNFGEGDDQSHWNYWKRELQVYRSGFLDALPDGLAAPRFYGTQVLPGDVACLWLEEVTDAYGDAWPPERYALAARHLGRLNGLYAGERPLPDYPWLGRRRLRQWRDTFPEWQLLDWEHPLVRARYPSAETGNLRRMLRESEDFLVRLERLPHTICHGDAYPTNFKSRHAAGGEVTIALDWALAHDGPVGYDLGSLALGAYLNRPEAGLSEIDSALFAAYMAGLRDSGYEIDSRLVRFGYAASAVLLIAVFQLMMLYMHIQEGAPSSEDGSSQHHPRQSFEGAMADMACELRELV